MKKPSGRTYIPRGEHYKEFLGKLPSIAALERLLKSLDSEAVEEDLQTLEDVLVVFNRYMYTSANRPALRARFNPILKAMVGSIIAELGATEHQPAAGRRKA